MNNTPAVQAFLQGNQLPARWAQRARFVIVDTAFGQGQKFLATWQVWRQDPARCERLFYVALAKHPPPAADVAPQLRPAWPALTPNLHVLDFESGGVQLLLAVGDAVTLLPRLRLAADAFYLDAGEPEQDPRLWQARVMKALGRRAAPGATLCSPNVATRLHTDLGSAGFEVDPRAGQGTVARWAPRYRAQRLPSAAVAHAQSAVVVGAGLAGAAAAQALARLGLKVTVLDRQAEPAAETSGNAAGLFHGTVNADDGPYARLYRAAALYAHQVYAAAITQAGVEGSATGLLRLVHEAAGADADARPDADALNALLQRLGLPPSYVHALSAEAASARAGVPLAAPAWFYPGGGWIAPAAWVRQALSEAGVSFVGGVNVQRLTRAADGPWQLHGADGRLQAQAPIVVLANAASAGTLLAALGHPIGPLHHSRGQVTQWAGPHGLRMPVAGDGYAIPIAGALLCGATREVADVSDLAVRPQDHAHNLARLQSLCGLRPPAAAVLQGRTGWRLHADDRLPIAGAMPCVCMPASQRLDQARLLPREPGLFVLTALGARGLTLAPLLGRLVAAMATGAPWPLEQDLADAIDPGRWRVRAARTATRAAGNQSAPG